MNSNPKVNKQFGDYFSLINTEYKVPNKKCTEARGRRQNDLFFDIDNREPNVEQEVKSSRYYESFSILCKKLIKCGFSREHAVSCIDEALNSIENVGELNQEGIVGRLIKKYFSGLELNARFFKGRNREKKYFMTVGPTGVGKTATIMKLALHPDFFGGLDVGIISINRYQMGGNASLGAFSEITSIPFIEIGKLEDVHSVERKFKHIDYFLIDTPGRGPSFSDYVDEIRKYIYHFSSVNVQLVLSATSDILDSKYLMEPYIPLNPLSIIITKLDETSKPGKIITLAREFKLPISCVCNGQSIPEDIMNDKKSFNWFKNYIVSME